MKKMFALLLGTVLAGALLASCSGNTQEANSRRDNTTTTTTAQTDRPADTTTSRADTTTGKSPMSKAEEKVSEIGEGVADGIDTTLSTAGDVADTILR